MVTEKQKTTMFKGQGLGIGHSRSPVCVQLPPDLDALVRSLPNRSEFMRQAIVEKLRREGLLSEDSSQ